MLLGLGALLSASAQILWFWPKCIHQIDYDGMAYTGIAEEINEGLFHASINGFRSPLISWLIAATRFPNVFAAGKIITILAYVATLFLIYAFAYHLWRSHLVAGAAMFLFTLCRGITFDVVAMINPDFLFMALTLLYFLVLLHCFRRDRYWLLLGAIHGIAFLAKAFALPWLAVLSLTAVVVSNGPQERKLGRLALACAFPLIIACFWSAVLHAKYGTFTTGTQFKTNYLQWVARAYRNHKPATYRFLTDITGNTDDHMVDDPMAPGTWPWSYKLQVRSAIPSLFKTELKNAPLMLKELAMLVNAGVLLSFIVVFFSLASQKEARIRIESKIVIIAAVGCVVLVAAYSMLVVDSRYLLPVVPIIVAIGSRFLIPDTDVRGNWRYAVWGLTIVAFVGSLAYASSPYRVQKRDFQIACYRAAMISSQHSGRTIVSVGWGPFPDHGVGWEAGYKTAYLAGKRLIATAEQVPSEPERALFKNDMRRTNASILLLWGKDDADRRAAADEVGTLYGVTGSIVDPYKGDVGLVLSRRVDAQDNRHGPR